jgi:starvation-inducible DNA-binding protein
MAHKYTVPALDDAAADRLIELLQGRLTATIDLQLTLKHVHWNVVGPSFIGVHEMIDPQVDKVREMSDEIAERIATLGGSPVGTPGYVAENRSWDDYSIGRENVQGHLAAIDLVYDGVVADHRRAIEEAGELDPVTEDLLIDQAKDLELFQWFVRAHLESAGGELRHQGASSEREAVQATKESYARAAADGGDRAEQDAVKPDLDSASA